MSETTAQLEAVGRLAGKYLTFALADEQYGLGLLKVREVVAMMDITAVPRVPDFIRGIINLRGQVIPVIDLRARFTMPAVESTPKTCIVVAYVGEIEVGLVVDHVLEVLELSEGQVEETPSLGADVDTGFILGIGKTDDAITILLDIDKVLGRDAITMAHSVADGADVADSNE
jgi:purine-binding chemotaxis protein CheW